MRADAEPKLALLESMVREVGQQLRAREATGVRAKGKLDLVSDLDFWAESEVTRFLAEQYPGDLLLSEESANSVAYGERIWILDPLDGTVNRTSGIPLYALSLALLENGHPQLAFIYEPEHDELYFAERGRGATLNDQTLTLQEQSGSGIALTSQVVRRLCERSPENLVELITSHGRLRGLGAQALHLAYVAAGRLSLAVSLETKLWDNAAGALLVTEAGGRYTDLDGRDPFPIVEQDEALRGAANGCIAASPEAFERIFPLLAALGSTQ